MDAVLDLLAKESYFLRPSKCVFEQMRIEYLGVIVDGNTLSIDPAKADSLRNWPRTLTKVKEVRSILGVLGYQRPFIPNYTNIAKPLTELTKKDQPFIWTQQFRKALDTLIDAVLSNPALLQPDPAKPFFLQVDASAFATGAILTQKDHRGKHAAVGFHSQTFSDAERNYDIHDCELLALMRGLNHWRHLLVGTPTPITVYTDHKNLQYYCHPQHINRRVARYIPCLADYNYVLVHLPGDSNKADALSRRPDLHSGADDNDEVLVLPPSLFLCASHSSSLDDRVRGHQLTDPATFKRWSLTFPLTFSSPLWFHGDRLVVADNLPLRRGVISLYHDSPTAGHPGITKSTWLISKDYWWPNMKTTITNYIKGCTTCQSRKNNPTNPKPPLFPIPSDMYTLPFESIALDFIVKLPCSDSYDTILTITDTFSKASIFIPCNETIDAEKTAALYANYILPHYGLPSRIISDRDPCFTSTFTKELCRLLQIEQNISTAYHPQTDGQSEHTNQWLEQYLCIFSNFHQTDWARWLPLAQYAHNSWPSATTKKAPFELIMGHIPRVHQPIKVSTSPSVTDRLQQIKEARQQAAEAIKRSQELMTRISTRFTPYCVGEKVWLDACNLNTSHPSAKLAPRRYGPFTVTKAISRTSFRLELPPQWKVHPVFHASLLTPYKETREHGPNFTEPPPDLIDGQPEWEVEAILGARRHRKQLQYLVRWKGFSEAHDSWEPLTHIHSDHLISEFHQKHPTAIRRLASLKPAVSNPLNPLLIRSLKMTTTPPTTISSPFAEEYIPLPPSTPRSLATTTSSPSNSPPLSLEERITDAPPSLSLAERIGEEVESFQTPLVSPEHSPPPTTNFAYTSPAFTPMHPDTIVPDGYEFYDPIRFPNHDKYGQKIVIDQKDVVDPDAIRFEHNYVDHQHYVMAVTRRATPPPDPYGWPLNAFEFVGPSVEDVKETDLTVFGPNHTDHDLVDIGLYNINDFGLVVDVDRFRGYEEEQVHLIERQQRLDQDKLMWGLRMGPVRERLTKAKARSRLHPYLIDPTDARIFEPNPAISHPADWPVEMGMISQTISIQDALQLTEEGHHWLPHPWYHDEAGPGSNTMRDLMVSRCVYCLSRDHSIMYCPRPHHLCDSQLSCIIPTYHRNFGTGCPHTRWHYLDMGDDELVIPDDGYTSD